MSHSLMPFTFQGSDVRTLQINGVPWFVVNDVCRILEISNPRDVASRIDSRWVGSADVTDSLGRTRATNIVNEPGLYELIFRSDKPEAKTFRTWIFEEVLPQIRKTGQYAPAPMSALDIFAAAVEALREQERRTAAIEAQQAEIGQRQDAIENRVTQLDANSGWVTAMGWSNVNGLTVTDNATMARLGRKASAMLRGMGIERRTTTSEVFGIVNIYPEGVLEQAAEELGLI